MRNQRPQEPKKCFHKRIKKNYPFGRKSNPAMKCKDCGEVITPFKLKEDRKGLRKKRR